MEFQIDNISDLDKVSQYLIGQMNDFNIFLLHGDLGAGKTTLVKNWMSTLGIKDLVNSPTFSIVNEYDGASFSVYHMDMYRLKSVEEALDLGIEEYLFDTKGYCLIEWPDIILDVLTLPFISIKICQEDNSKRIIKVNE